MRRPSKDSIITIGILFFISIFFSILLIIDFQRRGGIGNNPQIGEITFKERTVHRKIDSSVVWDEVENHSPVANKDTIRTLDYSDAVLTLKDGTSLRLSDNSMIYVDLSDKNLNINFDYGSISTSREDGLDSELTKLSITSGDKVIEIGNGGAAKLSKNDDENINIQIEKGQAKLNLNGKEEILQTNQTAELRENKIDVKPIRFLLQYPTDGKYYSTSAETINTEFKWSALDKGTSAEIQIAKDKSFKNITKKQSGIRETGISFALNPGIYFWRIGAKNPMGGKQEYSETRKLTVFSEKSIVVTTPQDGKVFTYTIKLPTVALRWTKNDFASSYKVEIAADSNFASIIKSLDSFENYISTDIPFKGDFYIRVTTRPKIPDLLPVVSPVSKFSIEERQIPYPPEIVSPVVNAVFGLDYIQRTKILFNWRDNREFANYEMELSKTPDFSSVVVKQNIKENFITPELIEQPGNMFWRVRGVLPDGRKSDYSKVNSFRIAEPSKLKLLYPEDGSELDMDSDKSVTFKWQRPETSGEFILEISNSPDFSNLVLKEEDNIVSGFSKKVFLKSEGKYYWRLKLLSREKKEITSSDESSFTILGAPTPKPISPTEGALVDLVVKPDIDFSWTKDEKAASYYLEIFDTTFGANKLIYSNTVSDTFYNYKDIYKMRDGSFIWRVSILYVSKSGKMIKSPPASTMFNVKIPSVEEPKPVVISPVNGADIVIGEKEEIQFQWEKNDQAVYYQIDVQEKFKERTRPVFQKQITDTNALFEIPLTIGEGVYYWDLFIFYKTWDGRVIRSKPLRNDFTLKFPYRNPPIPVLNSPSDSQEIKPDDNWQVPLTWQSDERALSYNVSISEYDTNKVIFNDTVENTKSTFVVSDSAIKPGKYVWSVSINYKAKDERIVKSPPRKREFTLTMPSFDVPILLAISPDAEAVINPIEQTELEFKWEKSDSATLYTVELYQLNADNPILIAKKDTKENSFIFKEMSSLSNGYYMWKLKISYKDRKMKTIMTEPLLTEFLVSIPSEDIIEPPQILTKPRLYVE
ncbi:MAG: FecR domain-containing protein [Leptospiraceae bacterium]|nr:FecR domain-containing protein [Leptospiraceae bacterium]